MRNYGELSTGELRELCVNGELNADLMSLSDYERLFDYETDLDEPQSSVLVFCSNGLNQHEAYGKHLPKPTLESIFEKHEQMFGGKTIEPEVKKRRFVPTSRWGRIVATIAICVAVGLIALQGVAMAMGYDNFVHMIRSAINSSDGRATNPAIGRETFLNDDVRFYDSLEALLEYEYIDVLLPAHLPSGYAFSHFEIDDTSDRLRIILSATEPFISFIVFIGAGFQVEDYTYEINNIKYSIDEVGDNLYQAHWIDGEDYYTIVVSDRAIISEIINNLTRE
jgi:hypothetical protein